MTDPATNEQEQADHDTTVAADEETLASDMSAVEADQTQLATDQAAPLSPTPDPTPAPVVDPAQYLPKGRVHRGKGLIADLPDVRDHYLEFSLDEVKATPSKVDLRDATTGKLPAPYDQLSLGSCTANAIAAALEFLAIVLGMPSRLFIYFNERWVEGTVSTDAGAQIRDGIKVVAKAGVCPETEWPYDVDKFADQPPSKCYTDASQEVALSYARVGMHQFQLKAALASGFPVVVGFTAYDDLESEEVARTGVLPLPSMNESPIGGHAVLLVGYDDASGTWLLRNSWGSDWGMGGYFTMPYAYLTTRGLASDFWVIKAVGKARVAA